jgi:hypothetical protein
MNEDTGLSFIKMVESMQITYEKIILYSIQLSYADEGDKDKLIESIGDERRNIRRGYNYFVSEMETVINIDRE